MLLRKYSFNHICLLNLLVTHRFEKTSRKYYKIFSRELLWYWKWFHERNFPKVFLNFSKRHQRRVMESLRCPKRNECGWDRCFGKWNGGILKQLKLVISKNLVQSKKFWCIINGFRTGVHDIFHSGLQCD